MADDVKRLLLPRVVSTPELLRLETVSRDHAFNQNLDPAWLEGVISVEGHHLIIPELTHQGRPGAAAHLRSLLRIQLRTNLPWTAAPAMLSLLDLPFEVFESLPEPSIGTLNWIVDLTTEGIPTQAQVADPTKIKGEAIPEAAVEPLLAELQEMFARHGASSALVAKATIKPTKEFHTARHTLFTPEQNAALDKIMPISASVKTKLGRGGSDDE